MAGGPQGLPQLVHQLRIESMIGSRHRDYGQDTIASAPAPSLPQASNVRRPTRSIDSLPAFSGFGVPRRPVADQGCKGRLQPAAEPKWLSGLAWSCRFPKRRPSRLRPVDHKR